MNSFTYSSGARTCSLATSIVIRIVCSDDSIALMLESKGFTLVSLRAILILFLFALFIIRFTFSVIFSIFPVISYTRRNRFSLNNSFFSSTMLLIVTKVDVNEESWSVRSLASSWDFEIASAALNSDLLASAASVATPMAVPSMDMGSIMPERVQTLTEVCEMKWKGARTRKLSERLEELA